MQPVTVIVPLPPSYRGGTEEYAYRVLERVSHKVPARLVTTRVRWGHDTDALSTGQAEMVIIPGFEMFERPVVLSPRARRTLRSVVKESSLIHLHMPFPLVERWVSRWARRAGVPVVLTYHMDALLSSSILGPVAASMYRSVSARPALTAANRVISNSLGYAQSSPVLSDFLPKVQVIAKGVDPMRLGISGPPSSLPPGVEASPEAAAPRGRRILFVGRLVAYKGVPVLLDAVRQLIGEGVDVQLYLAGRGPEEAALRQQVSLYGLGSRVKFLGFVPDAQLGALYRWADVVACPSVSTMESSPTSLEEALSLGTPVLGSDLPGAIESIPSDGVQGLLVPPGDSGAVALGLRRLLEAHHWSPPRIRTWDDVAQDYLALFGSLVPGLISV
jgi:glycosyltransferase involved in cell wall biosynthesis